MNSIYFANLPEDEIGHELVRRVADYYEELDRSGRLKLLRKVYRYYYSLDPMGRHEGAEIRAGGEQKELALLKANHFRNLLNHLHVLVTQQKPSFECRAINTDYKSLVQTILGTNILEFYMREKRLAHHFRQLAEYCLVFAEGFIEIAWDETLGDDYAVDHETGHVYKTGDIATRTYTPLDVVRRIRADADKKSDWYILRRWVSRHDLAAEYPEFELEILNDPDEIQAEKYAFYPENLFTTEDDADLIAVYKLYHDRTPACPEGREVIFLGSGAVLEYGELSYPDLPVFRMAAYDQHGTALGYTIAFDLLCVQEAIDRLYSIVLSNQSAFGVQNLWMKPGTKLAPAELTGGLNILESMEKPEAINLTHTPPEIFNFLKQLEQLAEVLSGVNSVARGQPEASLKSGAALALVASQAVQFSNSIHAAYVSALEDSSTTILRILQTRATLPRTAIVAGKDNRTYFKEFTGEDLKSINRVIVDMGNPVARTIAGRIQMADQLLERQLIKRPEEYFQVMSTGRLENMMDNEQVESLLIQRENEELKEGRAVPVIAIDAHLKHINEHKAILSDPAVRRDPNLVQIALNHINEHINALRTVDPALLNALGQAPIAVGTPPQGANAPQPPENQPQDSNQMPAPPGTPPEIANAMPSLPEGTPPEMLPNNQQIA